ncbi:MAG: hypothetical protein SAL07_04250 [Oscillatoria sp. PMC 1051.18]|nr:hypothetical protein [Oscillatoria sp. PMC 1050.18]MEC5029103.1 hypothetical protein [Oscillatoria sp. PMC 1051.18]
MRKLISNSPKKIPTLISGLLATFALGLASQQTAKAQNYRYLEIGDSEYYGMPVYLDSQSVNPLDNNSYKYTTLVGLNNRESEVDAIVDCNDTSSLYLLEARYYDNNGNLEETEILNRQQQLNLNNPNYNANRTVCNELVQYVDIPARENVNYDRYYNPRFNFSVLYPPNLVSPQSPPQNNDGREFLSSDGSISMRVFGSNNALNQTLAEIYDEQSQETPSRQVTYRTRGEDWFVVSGYENGEVFYRKTYLRNGDFKTLIIRYNRALQPEFDPIVTEISQSFRG